VNVSYIPKGSKIESVTPDGKQGVTFNSKYAITGMTFPAIAGAKQEALSEGVNDQGLSFSGNQLNFSTAPPVGNDATKILSVADLGMWALGNFSTVAEVKAAVTSGNTEFWLPPVPIMGNALIPLHYAIYDKAGNGLVIQFQNNKTNVYDNPVNVLTNGPEFPWHLLNLNNYTQTNVDVNNAQYGKLPVATVDSGIALSGLPSSQTAAGRFVKAAFYTNYVRKAKTPDEAIQTLSHIMNNFDRPYDLTIDPPGGMGDGPRGSGSSSEVTTWTLMADLSRNLVYFRTIDALNWTMIDMAKLANITQIKSVPILNAGQNGAVEFNQF
jgi:penicillin V acylase-like amidase (Ntn superfamily)